MFSQPGVLAKTYVEPPHITQLVQALAGQGFNPGSLTVEEMVAYISNAANKVLERVVFGDAMPNSTYGTCPQA